MKTLNEQLVPHKYADVIKAWADGKPIQFLHNNKWNDWASGLDVQVHQFMLVHNAQAIFGNYEWRIKPELAKYRLYLADCGDGPEICVARAGHDPIKSVCFIRWLGDWQKIEIRS